MQARCLSDFTAQRLRILAQGFRQSEALGFIHKSILAASPTAKRLETIAQTF